MRRSDAIEYREKRFSLRKPMVKRRRCLMCGKAFLSKGPHNRRCKRCNLKIAQAGENAFYEPRVYSTNYQFDEWFGGLD
ncbi:MAG: hypothetical protein HYW14_05810 [Planctomycetes bacterium]|nr:hypothetical protein [Planctomycetota bacterium]